MDLQCPVPSAPSRKLQGKNRRDPQISKSTKEVISPPKITSGKCLKMIQCGWMGYDFIWTVSSLENLVLHELGNGIAH